MARRLKTEGTVNIFNFSFLDILSCTLGALIFILVMEIISNTFTATQSDRAQKIRELEAQYQTTKSAGEELIKRKAQIRTELMKLENAIQASREIAKLTSELSMKKKELANLQQKIQRTNEKKIQIWAPREFETDKKPILPLVFQDQRVAPLDEPFFEIITDRIGLPGSARRLKQGEDVDIALSPRAKTASMIAKYDKKYNYIPMVVYPSGFSAFLKIRNWLIENEWDYSLILLSEDAPLEFGPGVGAILR
jgi:hypothetical protein